MIFLVLFIFLKPFHSHISKPCAHQTQDHHSNEGHHDKDTADCGSDCACPQHRVNGCSPMTALTKSERIIILKIVSSNEFEKQFMVKQSPILDGPFRPPLS